MRCRHKTPGLFIDVASWEARGTETAGSSGSDPAAAVVLEFAGLLHCMMPAIYVDYPPF
jgi:hypothetical protein